LILSIKQARTGDHSGIPSAHSSERADEDSTAFCFISVFSYPLTYVDMIAIVALLSVLVASCNAFYLPGVAPYDFKRGETVDLKVNKLR
jgi:hypothetical protein